MPVLYLPTQTGNAAPSGKIVACAGGTVPPQSRSRRLETDGTSGSAFNLTIPPTGSGPHPNMLMLESAVGEPGVESWRIGTWRSRLNVTAGSAFVRLREIHICRVNKDGVSLGTVAKKTDLNIGLTAGVKTHAFVGASTMGETTDRIYVVYKLENTDVSSHQITILPDQVFDTPIELMGFYESTAQTCRIHWRQNVADLQPLSTQYDNLPLEDPPAVWADVMVRFDDPEEEVEVGQQFGSYVVHGMIRAELHAPAQEGMDLILGYADAAASACADQLVSEVAFGEARIERLGEIESEQRVGLEIPFLAPHVLADRPQNVDGLANTFDEVQDAVNTKWRTDIADPVVVPTQYDALGSNKANQSRWVRLWHRPAASFSAEGGGAGATTRRVPGYTQADIHVPWGTGERDVLALADVIDDAFRMSSYKGICFSPVQVGDGQRIGAEWVRGVRIPWTADTEVGGGFGAGGFGSGPFGG